MEHEQAALARVWTAVQSHEYACPQRIGLAPKRADRCSGTLTLTWDHDDDDMGRVVSSWPVLGGCRFHARWLNLQLLNDCHDEPELARILGAASERRRLRALLPHRWHAAHERGGAR